MKQKKSFYRAILPSLVAAIAAVLVVKLGDSNGGWVLHLGVGLIALGGFFLLVALVIELIHSHHEKTGEHG